MIVEPERQRPKRVAEGCVPRFGAAERDRERLPCHTLVHRVFDLQHHLRPHPLKQAVNAALRSRGRASEQD